MKVSKLDTNKTSHCARCEKKFVCTPENISACDCSKIELSKEEYRFINSKFKTCICNPCLMDLKNEYNVNFHYNKPKNFRDKIIGIVFLLALFPLQTFHAQTYAPPVSQPGTTAMYKDSSVFVNWALHCSVNRGYQDITNPALGFASVGDTSMVTGKAQDNGVLSLGDGGSATCTFIKPIKNGLGYDFAVFENGFDDVFLELAFVEVSSDGVNFFRFPAHSLTDTTVQTLSFGSTDATKINNLAGKYRGGYGTPFDLQELAGTLGLNVDYVTHVKIIDVIGNIDKTYASRDFYHRKVNDPWPTPFPSGGFDLDAVGVIHESTLTGIEKNEEGMATRIYPNPVNVGEALTCIVNVPASFELLDASGNLVIRSTEPVLKTDGLNAGLYCLKIITASGISAQKVLVR